MNLGFQGWFLTEPHTGIGQHCIGLLRALAKKSSKKKDLKLHIVVPRAVSLRGIPRTWIALLPTKKFLLHRALKKWYWERVQVPQYFAKKNLDWEYYPYPCPLPRRSSHLRALTVHDGILWKDPRYKGKGLKRIYHQESFQSLKKVEQVFTVSEATRRSLNLLNAHILPNAVPETRAQPSAAPTRTLVYLGGYDLRKNVPDLVETLHYLNQPPIFKRKKFELLLLGKAHHQSPLYPEVPNRPNVRQTGPLTDEEIEAQLKSAFAFLHFSDSEGFNIPLLQAMKAGTPAIVKDLLVNREVSKNTALFLPNTHDKNSLQRALSAKLKMLENPKQRARIIQAQKKAAKQFSWGKSAEIFLKTLQKHGARN